MLTRTTRGRGSILAVATAVLALGAACGQGGSPDAAAPPLDARDVAAVHDVPALDVGTMDAVSLDAATPDANAPDVAAPDATAPDVRAPDGCVPTTCAAHHFDCGALADGCGRALDCGACALPRSCGAAEMPNVCAGGGAGSTYYVALTGSDGNPGTLALPFRHVSRGAAAAHAGDTVVVADGTYDNEGVVGAGRVVTLTNAGTAGHPITFMAQHRGLAVLDAMNTATGTSCNGASAYFDIAHASYVTIQGFVIQRGCDAGIQSNEDAHDITFRWNEIRQIANHTVTDQYGRDGIFLNAGESDFTFDGNVFHDIGRTDGETLNHFDHGIYACAARLTIINNVFYNMNRGYAIQSCGSATGWLIANNTFAFPPPDGGQIMLWNGDVTPPGTVSSFQIVNNVFYQPRTVAIDNYATLTGITIANNLVFGAGASVINDTTGCTLMGNRTGMDPLFVNATTAPYDFHLRAGSPGVDTGVRVAGVNEDRDTVSRPQGAASDLGAYER